MKRLEPPWYWLGAQALLASDRRRSCVLGALRVRDSEEYVLGTCDDEGRMVPIDPEGPLARRLASLPELLTIAAEAARVYSKNCRVAESEACVSCRARKLLRELGEAVPEAQPFPGPQVEKLKDEVEVAKERFLVERVLADPGLPVGIEDRDVRSIVRATLRAFTQSWNEAFATPPAEVEVDEVRCSVPVVGEFVCAPCGVRTYVADLDLAQARHRCAETLPGTARLDVPSSAVVIDPPRAAPPGNPEEWSPPNGFRCGGIYGDGPGLACGRETQHDGDCGPHVCGRDACRHG